MGRIIYRQLIGHEDFALGSNIITQKRGDKTVDIRQIELEFIFRTVNEIKLLDYLLYAHIGLFSVTGPVIQYYFDPASMAIADDNKVIRPNSLLSSQAGRYLKTAANVLDTIIAAASDEYTPIVADGVTPKTTFRAPYPLDLSNGHIRINLTTAPLGSVFIVDVYMNGVTLFSTLLQIDVSENTSVTANTQAVLSITDVPDDAKFEVYVIQVGSTVAGTGLKVAVTGSKV